jgi:high-affinity Fe2+/Pb2+ permease
VSTAPPVAERQGPAETVAGFLAALAIFGGLIAIAQRPVTIGLTSLFIGLIAATMAGGRNRHLAAAGVAVAATGWLVGMIVSVLTSRPLW